LRFCIDPFDPRIHCCLNCGTVSSPPLAVYRPEDLAEQLDSVVNYFLMTRGMRFDPAKHELWLDHIFSWYRKDFEQQEEKLLDFVIKELRDNSLRQELDDHRKHLKIRFMEYDWSLNGE